MSRTNATGLIATSHHRSRTLQRVSPDNRPRKPARLVVTAITMIAASIGPRLGSKGMAHGPADHVRQQKERGKGAAIQPSRSIFSSLDAPGFDRSCLTGFALQARCG